MVENAATLNNDYLGENAHKEKVELNVHKICQNTNKDWLKGCEEHYNKSVDIIVGSTITIYLIQFAKQNNVGFGEEISKRLLNKKIKALNHV